MIMARSTFFDDIHTRCSPVRAKGDFVPDKNKQATASIELVLNDDTNTTTEEKKVFAAALIQFFMQIKPTTIRCRTLPDSAGGMTDEQIAALAHTLRTDKGDFFPEDRQTQQHVRHFLMLQFRGTHPDLGKYINNVLNEVLNADESATFLTNVLTVSGQQTTADHEAVTVTKQFRYKKKLYYSMCFGSTPATRRRATAAAAAATAAAAAAAPAGWGATLAAAARRVGELTISSLNDVGADLGHSFTHS
jgi:hypothetical protein